MPLPRDAYPEVPRELLRQPRRNKRAETIDALVAALTKAAAYVPDDKWHLMQEIDAALALANPAHTPDK